MDTFKHLICKLKGHRWMPAKFYYWRKDKNETWGIHEEDATYCGRCGYLIIPNSEVFIAFREGKLSISKCRQ